MSASEGMRALHAWDAQALAAAFANGRVHPADALSACLAQIARHDHRLGVCNHVVEEHALMEAADSSAERWRKGAPLSPLDGVAFGVKANIAVRGLPWHGGIAAYEGRCATADAACVARLRTAGMIPLALLNMHEAALGETSHNPAFRTTRNPHGPAHIPGGSSGGSAAAVAAGMAPIALGTDSLGSVRLPSALCGVVGFKPAHGEIPMEGVMPLSARLDHVGIHARSVGDVVAVMGLFGGLGDGGGQPPSDADGVSGAAATPPLAAEAASAAVGASPFIAGAGGLDAVGLLPDGDDAPPNVGASNTLSVWRLAPDLQIADSIAQAFAKLLQERSVHEVLDWSDVDLSALRRAGLLMCERDAAAHFAQALNDHPQGFSPTFRRLVGWAAGQPQNKVLRAEARLDQAKHRLRSDLRGRLLLSPTMPHLPPKATDEVPVNLADLTAPAAIAGVPAISLPMGAAGLPMGVQLAGLNSASVLAGAKACFPGVAPVAKLES